MCVLVGEGAWRGDLAAVFDSQTKKFPVGVRRLVGIRSTFRTRLLQNSLGRRGVLHHGRQLE